MRDGEQVMESRCTVDDGWQVQGWREDAGEQVGRYSHCIRRPQEMMLIGVQGSQ